MESFQLIAEQQLHPAEQEISKDICCFGVQHFADNAYSVSCNLGYNIAQKHAESAAYCSSSKVNNVLQNLIHELQKKICPKSKQVLTCGAGALTTTASGRVY